MIDTQALRMKILDAAIRGKLTMQLPEDGNAEDLYNEIQNEKQSLIKEGKIKKEKPLPEIAEKDIPFDIPGNWRWVRLSSLLVVQPSNGYSPKPVEKNTGFRNLTLTATSSGCFKEVWKYVDISTEQAEKFWLKHGDILIQRSNSRELVGTACLYPLADNTYIFPDLMIRVHVSSLCNEDYILRVLSSSFIRKYFISSAKGTSESMPKINQSIVKLALIPLPPFVEQKRIVSKIDAIFSQLDQIDKEQKNLADNSIALRNKLLELGIRGKLTAQLASDGDAEMLYDDIQNAKQRLIKEGKIKKEKPLPEITEDDIPFDIPENWKWVRLADVVEIRNGFTPSKTNPLFWKSKDIPWFTVFDKNKQGSFISSTEQYISNSAIGTSSDRIVPKDSVLLCCTASIGEYAYTLIDLTTNQQWNGLTPKDIKLLYSKYLFYWVQTKKKDMLDSAGTTTFPFLSTKKLGMFVFPLPPLSEQKRIVEKLDQLLPLCDAMSAEIAGGESA